jgi:hypothetical protein
MDCGAVRKVVGRRLGALVEAGGQGLPPEVGRRLVGLRRIQLFELVDPAE